MINLLLGPPGGGKSYEAVVYHILVALNRGRKVITNLPLLVDEIELICPGARDLIELRDHDRVDGELTRPFSHISHYGDTWRHPGDGSGPLYVIDECHMCLPLRGTPIAIEEWFSMHRHELADVLLITQSYGKINRAIRDLTQVVYRCRKATAFGSNGRYIRKVQDGLRGEVVNQAIRSYEKKYFKLYRSHTRSGAGQELASADIRPIWSNWTFKGAAICFLLFLVMLANMDNPFKPKLQVQVKDSSISSAATDLPAPRPPVVLASPPVSRPSAAAPPAPPDEPPPAKHPWSGYGLHVVAIVQGERDGHPVLRGLMRVSQNGQAVATLPFQDLMQSGYELAIKSDCVVSLRFGGQDVGYAVCDAPKVGMSMPSPAGGSGG